MAEVRVDTLLGAWIEQVRAARDQTLADLVATTGLSELTILRTRREMGRPWARTLAGLAEYLRVDETVVIALWQTPSACGDVHDMRRRQRRVSDRLSKFAQMLDKVRQARGQTLRQVAVELLMCEDTVRRARAIVPQLQMRTWRRLADYVGRSVEECKELAASPAGRVVETYPVLTFNGAKWHPTVPAVPCGQCPFYEPWMRDVVADDFAWCEAVIPEDFQPD